MPLYSRPVVDHVGGGRRKLQCVRVDATISKDAEPLGVGQSALADGLLVRLKSRLPRLLVADRRPNLLSVTVNARPLEVRGTRLGFFGAVELTLIGQVVVRDTGNADSLPTWTSRFWFQGGLQHSAAGTALEALDGLLDGFGAEYYRAGNP